MIDLSNIQNNIGAWAEANFESRDPVDPLLGAIEELGELCHAHLKERQGIRGTPEEHQLAARDAIGDCVIYLCDYCYRRGWDLEQILHSTWAQVQHRNWKANPTDGANDE